MASIHNTAVRRVGVGLAVATLAAAGYGLTRSVDHAGAARGPARVTHHSAKANVHIARAHFAVLRSARIAADDDAAVDKMAGYVPTLDVADARLLESSSIANLWLLPESDGNVCLGYEPSDGSNLMGMACAPGDVASASGIEEISGGEYALLIPDGVSSVSVSSGGDPATQVAVDDNVVLLDPGTYTVTYTDQAGQQELSLKEPTQSS
jgi:hypothetical protein